MGVWETPSSSSIVVAVVLDIADVLKIELLRIGLPWEVLLFVVTVGLDSQS